MTPTLGLKFTLDDVKGVVHKWLYLEDDRIIDVMMASYVANRLKADPLWMIFIAPPSHTKTELLRAFDGHPKAFLLSTLTDKTLISGIRAKEDKQPSLIFRLTDKTLILKDFTSILSMRSEPRQEILSQLREIYDGDFTKSFGTGNTIKWKGHMGLMAACTPVYDRHYAVIGVLGDRFLLYRTHILNGERMGHQAQQIVGQETKMRKEIQGAVHKFISQFDKLPGGLRFKSDEKLKDMIITLAEFCAYARCVVERDYRNRDVTYYPESEGPARLVKQFMQLGNALALIYGKTGIDEEIYTLIKKVGCDLISAFRIKILRYLWENEIFEHLREWRKTRDVASDTSVPTNTVKMILEDLMIVKLLNRDRLDDGETSPYHWQLSQKAYDMAAGARVFQESHGMLV
jgi:hypothetical protein